MKITLGRRTIDAVATPLVMGVLNVTPDSFSDGGEFLSPERALEAADRMVADGAAIIDVGPESSRPGSRPVPADEQCRRAVPEVAGIRQRHESIVISIDTRRASVARAAIEAGADVVNDISALGDDPEMAEVVGSTATSVILMHMKGTPLDMQAGGGPDYDDLIDEIRSFLLARREAALRAGIPAERILFDPGLGFGKRVAHNLEIMNNLARFVELGIPVVVGASRKSFIGNVLGVADPRQRLAGSLACAAVAAMAGVAVIRVHNVRQSVEVVRICQAIRHNRPGRSS